MRIAMIVFNDFVNDLRVHKEARDLVAAGHEVTILAARSRAHLPETETRSGYTVRRIRFSAAWRTSIRGDLDRLERRSSSLAGRVVDAVRRFPPRRRWIAERNRRRFGRGVAQAVRALHPDVIHAHDLDTLDLGTDLAGELGVPLVYDSHELWRANNFMLKRPVRVQRRWQELEASRIGRAAAVIITTESRAARLREWYPGVDPVVVMNCQDGDPTLRTTALRDRLGIDADRRILLYQGLMHEDRGITVALDALPLLSDAFVFVAIGAGAGAARFTRTIAHRRLGHRAFHVPEVPHHELAPLTASADYGLSLIQNTSESYYLSAPNKLFEFMRAGLPVVASDFPEVRRILDLGDVGEAVDPADPAQVAAAIGRLEADPARRDAIRDTAHRLLRERYNWQLQSAKLLGIYERLR